MESKLSIKDLKVLSRWFATRLDNRESFEKFLSGALLELKSRTPKEELRSVLTYAQYELSFSKKT